MTTEGFIVHILHIITGLDRGGAERTLVNLVTGDSRNRHTVLSLTDIGAYGQDLVNQGVRVIPLTTTKSMMGLVKTIALVRKVTQTLGPDIVQTWMYHADFVGGLGAWLAGHRAIVWNIRASRPSILRTKPSTYLLVLLLAGLSWFVPARIIVCADKARSDHGGLLYRQSRMTTIPNGFDVEKWKRDEASRESLRREWGVSNGEVLVGMVGRYHPDKNHPLLFRTARTLMEEGLRFKLLFAGKGTGPDNSRFLQLLQNAHLDGQTISLGEREDLPEIMSAIDLLVVTSLSEGFPNVLAEAMLCETPCVSSQAGDSSQIVAQNGWTFSPNDSSKFTLQLQLAVSENPTERKERGLKSRAHIIQNYSRHTMVKQYLALYQCLLIAQHRTSAAG